jgi:hypothetical protein
MRIDRKLLGDNGGGLEEKWNEYCVRRRLGYPSSLVKTYTMEG